METILYNIGQVLGITIIHSLWQGLILYIVLRIVFIAVPTLSSVKKYNLAIMAVVSVAAWFFYTLFSEFSACNWVNIKAARTSLPVEYAHLLANQQRLSNFRPSFYNTFALYLPYVSVLYIIGLTVNLTKLGWEWNKIRLIKQALIPAEQMQQYINKFSKKLNINKDIQLNFSKLVNVPCTIGYFKPIILLPVSLATQLSACEVEAILLHELSHIKRNDYLINLLQQVISVMLFFNPFAQLINRIINIERENGCDDLVVEKTGKPLIYAQALLKLEENRDPHLKLALAATGKKHYLLNRIERIMKTKKPTGNIRHLLIATLLLAGGLTSIAWFNPEIAAGKNGNATGVKPQVKTEQNLAPQTLTTLANFVDSNKYIRFSDTTKHRKALIMVIDSNGNKKEYDPNDSLQADSLLFNLNQNFNFNLNFNNRGPWNDSLKKFYSSAEWKAQMETMRKQGEQMQKQFNSQAWKNQVTAMAKQGELMKKQFNSQAWKNQTAAMQKQGELMNKQFNSQAWKKQVELMQKQGEQMQKQFDSPEWKQQMELMQKQAEEMQKQFDSPQWKQQMRQWQWNFQDSTGWDRQDTLNVKPKMKTAKPMKKSTKPVKKQ